MFLLVPAHPGFPGQIPQSRKTVVCVCVCIIIPLVKDKSADITDTNNYSGITLSSVISKLFEMCLVEVFF